MKNNFKNLGLVTNISYAHIKNFNSLKGVANAKSELINNITENGTIILNADDKFFKFFKSKSIKNKLWPLGSDIEFIPGHGPSSTFAQERATNAFVADSILMNN